MLETRLPNGLKIFCRHKYEVPVLYEQIEEYCKNGIQLHEGDTVFDVGANIGLFALWAYQHCNKDVTVYAFEPIPAVFEVLFANAQRFDVEKIKALPYGLSYETKMAAFTYYPNATSMSTPCLDSAHRAQDNVKNALLRRFKEGTHPFGRFNRFSFSWLRWLFRGFCWLSPSLRPHVLDYALRRQFKMQQISCKMKTASDVIREHNIQCINLFKVDVEESELDVLLGVEEQDWQKINQVVVEIHDLNHRVETITNLLKKHGLTEITIEQEPTFKGSNIFNVYATRHPAQKQSALPD